jgi:hypothetical protein
MAALANNLDQKRLQWVATKDIGIFAALAFKNPNEHNHKAISIAGDALNVTNLVAAFKSATGTDVQPTFWILGSVLTILIGEMGTMLKWFGSDGYGADILKVREMHPELLDMETWMKEESDFVSR